MKHAVISKSICFLKKYILTRKTINLLLLFILSYALGAAAASAEKHFRSAGTSPAFPAEDAAAVSAEGNWGLSFQDEGETPVGSADFDELAQYDAYYADDTEEKVLYLTFDAGYENGNTEPILNALKKHSVSATFFVVGTYIESEPDLIRRMVEEGHTVGNHTWHHPDMSEIAAKDSFRRELEAVEDAYRELTGQEMTKYYRPPGGVYSTENLKMARELGYKTFFWSLAYVDWYVDDQPVREEALNILNRRIHPGAIVLLHSTSKTNARILQELIQGWKDQGYRFASLDDLTEQD